MKNKQLPERQHVQIQFQNNETSELQKKAAYFQPNMLRKCFVVGQPMTVFASDISKFKCFIRGRIVTLQQFILVDIATGKVVTHILDVNIDSMKIYDIIKAYFHCLIIEERIPNQKIILHSDRGTEYCSKQYISLAQEFDFIQLSMSDCASPRDNSVVERMFRTIKTQLKPMWKKACLAFNVKYYTKTNDRFFESIEQAQQTYDYFIQLYNASHKNQRNLNLTPAVAETVLTTAVNCIEPPYNIASNVNPSTANQISLGFVQDVRTTGLEAYKELPKEQQTALNVNAIFAQNFARVTQNQMLILNTLEKKSDQITDLVNEKTNDILKAVRKRKKPKVMPQRLRTPLNLEMQNMLITLLKDKKINAYQIRATLSTLLTAALGCRHSEIRCITVEEFEGLMATRQIQITESKRNKIEIKVISNAHKSILEYVFNLLKQKLAYMDFFFEEEHYIFRNYSTKVNKPLSRSYYSTQSNQYLKKFEQTYNKEFKTDVHLRTHSARVNFVTSALSKHVPLEHVQAMVGHTDPRSTLRYNRYVLAVQDKLSIINSICGPVLLNDLEE